MNQINDRILIIQEEHPEERTPTIYIESSLLTKWKLRQDDRIIVSAGATAASLLINAFSSHSIKLKITSKTARLLLLPALDYPVQVEYNREKKELRVGPILSVLTDQSFDEKDGFGNLDMFLKEMSYFCTEKGLPFYVHRLQQIQSDDTLSGHWLLQNNWREANSPIPDVIYNRIHSRKNENSDYFREYIEHLKNHTVLFFNGSFLSKLEVHNILLSADVMIPYLPDTSPFENEAPFVEFLERHQHIYVKPSYGSQGRNICKLTRTAEGWVLEYSGNISDTLLFDTEEELFHTLKKNIKSRSFIIQQGIPLLEIDHKKVDFRVLLIKNKYHKWKVTSMVARIGNAGHIVSNLAQGADMKNGITFLNSFLSKHEAVELFHSIRKLALITAHCLTNSRKDLFGELGIDIGLDIYKHPWLIEVNSKPSKAFHGNYEKFRPSVKSIIDYMYVLYIDRISIM
jgi:glutathione synthase/RimK-type ligase-like ATP-grasp enzyme